MAVSPINNVLLTGRPVDYLCLAGSRLYGLDHPDSDYDFWAFGVPSPHDTFGLRPFEKFNTLSGKSDPRVEVVFKAGENTPIDLNVVSLRTFCHALLSSQIQPFELLAAPEDAIISSSFIGDYFRERRDTFLSQALYPRFRGYAESEWRRITGESSDKLGARRRRDLTTFGYVRKNACNCLRLLVEGSMLLSNVPLTFPLPDDEHELLLAVSAGETSMERLTQEYETRMAVLDKAVGNSPLPEYLDRDAVEAILIDAHRRVTLTTYGVTQ